MRFEIYQPIVALFMGLTFSTAFAQQKPKTPEDFARDAAITQFTRKMEAANYPALFERAAREFNVPVEILEGVSFAQTRWDHLIWPEGQSYSPESGKPRPYGIMSLWDNEFFGHSLIEAAKLIGKTPEDLKKDPFDNMRGGAALLRKIYDQTEKPPGTREGELESWRYAIAEYSGIPEPDFKHQHALEVYRHLAAGYDQYGIKLPKVPNLKLPPMFAEVKKIKDEEERKRAEKFSAEDQRTAGLGPVVRLESKPAASISVRAPTNIFSGENRKAPTPIATAASASTPRWITLAAIATAGVLLFVFLRKRSAPKR